MTSRRRWPELLLVIVAVAALAAFLNPASNSPPAEAPAVREPDAATTPMAASTPSQTPQFQEAMQTIDPEWAALAEEDFADAEGLSGYQEVLSKPIPASDPQTLQRGQAVFKANCETCHGAKGAGDGPAGRSLYPEPNNLRNPRSYKHGSLELGIYRSTFYGVEGTGMAPFEGVLTEEQIWDVVHYVRSLQLQVKK